MNACVAQEPFCLPLLHIPAHNSFQIQYGWSDLNSWWTCPTVLWFCFAVLSRGLHELAMLWLLPLFTTCVCPVDEEEDEEEVYKMAGVMAQCGGLECMLNRLTGIKDFKQGRHLLTVSLSFCPSGLRVTWWKMPQMLIKFSSLGCVAV